MIDDAADIHACVDALSEHIDRLSARWIMIGITRGIEAACRASGVRVDIAAAGRDAARIILDGLKREVPQ